LDLRSRYRDVSVLWQGRTLSSPSSGHLLTLLYVRSYARSGRPPGRNERESRASAEKAACAFVSLAKDTREFYTVVHARALIAPSVHVLETSTGSIPIRNLAEEFPFAGNCSASSRGRLTPLVYNFRYRHWPNHRLAEGSLHNVGWRRDKW